MDTLALLKEKQNVVYNILNNSLENNKLAHAYLFSGISGSLQNEAAYLLAQSLVCLNNTWACNTCSNCLRVKNDQYSDFIILDGSDHLIKKSEVIELQNRFSLTALEQASAKIFLIKAAHNMTVSAANSLLKFLEEPSYNVCGILISDDLEQILPTIKSRCTELNFNALSYLDNYNMAIQAGIAPLDAYYYSKVVNKYLEINTFLDDESYILFKEIFEGFLNTFIKNPNKALLIIQNDLVKLSNKSLVNEVSKMLMDMLIVFFNDVMSNIDVDAYYNDMCIKYRQINYLSLLEIVLEIKNTMANHISLALLFDQMFYKFLEVLQ